MANRHFAKLADVWKHLPLAEILFIERPANYWETHAGNASYAMVDDAERRYGAVRFAEVAVGFPALARSSYLTHLRSMNPALGPVTSYPGSPLLAMRELGATASYVFCDTDEASVADLKEAASRFGVASGVRVVSSDGMTALHECLDAVDGTILAHIDPYDPWARGPSGLSALDLASELIRKGIGLVYWYGYDRPDRQAWAFDTLSQGSSTTIWCGDVMIASHGIEASDGDLGIATTPGTGFGIVCANISATAVDACRELGEDLASAYEGIPMPDGSPGYLDFTVRVANGSD
jgi:23S rRNA A2030 N6-methylase RlmJ